MVYMTVVHRSEMCWVTKENFMNYAHCGLTAVILVCPLLCSQKYDTSTYPEPNKS